jgi:hypothetical protein
VGTAPAQEGLDVFISNDLQSKIENTRASQCQQLNNECVQTIKDLLLNPNTNLEARQDPFTLVILSVVVLIFAAVMANHINHKSEPVATHWSADPTQISQASAASNATAIVVVTTSNTPLLTITPKPDNPSVTG